MKKAEYKVVTGVSGLKELEENVSKLLNEGWKNVGGIAFNQGYGYQALARIVEIREPEKRPESAKKIMDNNNAMRMLDDLT